MAKTNRRLWITVLGVTSFGAVAGAAVLFFGFGLIHHAFWLLFAATVIDFLISRKLELFPFYSDKDLKRLERTKDIPIPEAEELRAYRKAHPEKNLAQAIADLREHKQSGSSSFA